MVAVDVDGTLIGDSLEVAPALRAQAARLAGRGVIVTLATGRVYSSALGVARTMGLSSPLITNGGALIRGPDGDDLCHLVLTPDQVCAVLALTGDIDGYRYVLTADSIHCESWGEHAHSYGRRLGVRVEVEPHLERLAAAGVTQVVVRVRPEVAEVVETQGRAALGPAVGVHRTLPILVEFAHPQATKGQALLWLAHRLGIPMTEVMAIGDGINDIDMVSAAGLGVLVANAAPSLWARADVVTKAPFHHGVLEAWERFILDRVGGGGGDKRP